MATANVVARTGNTNNTQNTTGRTGLGLFRKKPYKNKLVKVSKSSWIDWYRNNFNKTWLHTDKEAEFKAVYELLPDHKIGLLNLVSQPNNKIVPSYSMGNHKAVRGYVYYHGTQRACQIGEKTSEPCDNAECQLCCILRNSFRLKYTSPHGMFGSGIYSTPTSSKADTYAKNHHIHSSQHAIIVCTVVRGNVKQLYAADHSLTSPGAGFDSVEGMERQRGGAINYKEIVVYREDAIIPRAVIMYTRKGWAPPA